MLRYALYARKSKDDKSGIIKSIKDQIDIWKELSEACGLKISAVYEENKSAKTPGIRPIYKEMLAAVSKGDIDGILVWHVKARRSTELRARIRYIHEHLLRGIHQA